ncbi:MAG: fumarate hydratase, partial [Candidatus Tectomicrobia bacterium]|nr:fumarate hydratase [Candidatus Tectomicrobia bacterium]
MRTTEAAAIQPGLIREVAFELNRRAAIAIPRDVENSISGLAQRETQKLAKFVLLEIVNNYKIAVDDQRPMCADTGLPSF